MSVPLGPYKCAQDVPAEQALHVMAEHFTMVLTKVGNNALNKGVKLAVLFIKLGHRVHGNQFNT